MQKIRGRFSLKLTNNGNLIGEWSNHSEPEIFTESADLMTPKLDGEECRYNGTYFSTWREGNAPQIAELEISLMNPKQRINSCKYRVCWRDINSLAILFEGEGMIFDGVLIGNYFQPR